MHQTNLHVADSPPYLGAHPGAAGGPSTHIAGLFGLMFVLLLFGGLYFPTSNEGVISSHLTIAFLIFLSVSFITYIGQHLRITSQRQLANSLFFIAITLLFTIFSEFTEYAYGALAGYVSLALMLCLNIRDIRLPRWTVSAFAVVNVVNIVLAAGIVLETPSIQSFIISNYSAFYPELVEQMLYWWKKPVTTFGTHSLAGFFFFLFFYLNLRTYQARKGFHFLIFGVLYLVGNVLIASVTSYAFLVAGGAFLLHALWKKKLLFLSTFLGAGFLFLLISLLNPMGLAHQYQSIAGLTTNVIGSETNGLLGRYSTEGNLVENIKFLYEHPFSPVGISYSSKLFFGDSGIVEYLIRGSLFLLFPIYAGLLWFLRDNLLSKQNAVLLFATILLFEVGFTVLTHFRFISLLPVFVVYLNHIERVSKLPPASGT